MNKNFSWFVVLLSLVLLLQVPQQAGTRPQNISPLLQPSPARPVSAEVRDSGFAANTDFGRMPLYFIANRGQLDRQVAYYVHGKDKSLYFTPEGVTIVLAEDKKGGETERSPWVLNQRGSLFKDGEAGSNKRKGNIELEEKPLAGRWVVKLDFVGANPDVRPVGEEKTEALISYFKGRPEDWHTGLPTYTKVVYHDLWPGIDLIYSGTARKLKYEFLVHPGADPSRIRLAYSGTTGVDLNAEGRLEVATPAGAFADDLPLAYQELRGQRVHIPVAFRLDRDGKTAASGPHGCDLACAADETGLQESAGEKPSYGFNLGSYDQTQTLVIDPAVLVYCGYVGGNGWDNGYGIAVDGSGNVYITGATSGTETTFPVTAGPDLSWNGAIDAFVAKVNAAGTALLYCGFIGGAQQEYAYGIAVDSSGCAYVTGETISTQATFPVVVGPILTQNPPEPGAFPDAFVAKVSASGTSLVYCGYIGGRYEDKGYAIAVDGAGNAYITGHTMSDASTFPFVVGPGTNYSGGADIFVAKVNPGGTGFVYRGYVGAAGSEYGYGIAVDASGNAYITGDAYSGDFPVTVGPGLSFKGQSDAYVAKINAAGTALDYCGYIGGGQWDHGRAIAVDGSGCAYVTGYTDSTEATFPVTIGPDLSYNGGGYDAFVAKVSASGSSLAYCGYIGGAGYDYGYGIAASADGHVYLTGETASTEETFPVTRGPDLTYNGNRDIFVAKLLSASPVFEYCGYIGGTDWENGRAIAVDDDGDAYVTGMVRSSTAAGFPVTGGPDLSFGGFEDAFAAKIFYFDENIPKHAVGDFDGDGTDEAAVDFGPSGVWVWNAGTWGQIIAADPEELLAADLDGSPDDEIVADLGTNGLWIWNSGVLVWIGSVNPEGLAAGDVDGDGVDELAGDFGSPGLWLWNAGAWSGLSGVNPEYVTMADLDGAGGAEVIADFGPMGLWLWNAGLWTQLSALNPNHVRSGNTDGLGGREIVGDFGAKGLWLWAGGSWTQLSGVFPDFMMAADSDGNGDDEISADFGPTGLWFWDGGAWTQASGLNADFMIRANLDGGSDVEAAVDFGAAGLWLWDGAAWTQISGINPQYLSGADLDGDSQDEILADFGSLGLWIWNAGVWSQVSNLNPD